MANKRRPITQLPAINRTATLERFFGSTVDQLFQPGQTAAISGFIGRVPSYNNPEVDFYKSEPTAARKKYQLEATMVSQGTDGTINDLLFYDDLISRLSAEGALVSNADRLFKSEYWSWAPPIDIDKINNFQRYYWSGDDVPAVTLTLPGMELPTITHADGTNRSFTMPAIQPCWRILESDQRPAIDGSDGIFPGCPVALIDGVRTSALTLVDNNTIQLNVAPHAGAVVEVYRYGNIGDGVRTTYSFPNTLLQGIDQDDSDVHVYVDGREISAFSVVGDHVVLDTPPAMNSLVTVTLFDSLQAVITGRQYFNIENITHDPVTELVNGLKIALIDPYVIFFGFDIKPNSTFKWDEHRPNLFLVDGVGIAIHLLDLSLSFDGLDPQYVVVARDDDALPYFSRVNRWVQAAALDWFKGATVDRQAKRPICEMLPDMALWNYGRTRAPDADIVYGIAKTFDTETIGQADDFGRTPSAGDIVLFGNVGDFTMNNTFFIWPAIDDFGSQPMTYLATAVAEDVFLHNDTRREWHFDGLNWIECDAPGLFPLYDLFDNNGISIGNAGEYPASTFKGSRIFNFQLGTGTNEPVIGFPVMYDTYGGIMFENDLYTQSYSYRDGDIIGFHYYRTGESQFDNEWYKCVDNLPAVGSEARVVVPLNLQANPNFDTPKLISRDNWFAQFSSIATNQIGFEGEAYSTNNWQYTSKDLSRGDYIIQSRSPLLKLMMLMSDNTFDLKKAISFVESEYTRYKLKVRQKIKENLKQGLYIDEMDDDAEIVKIFSFIAANKTADFPFFLSQIGGGQFFIPLTPAAMGLLPLVKPFWVMENGVKFLVGHDGSKTASVDDITDRLLYAMENRIFESRETIYDAESRPYLDEYDLFSGKFRTADYSRDEANVIMQAEFEDWARTNNADYITNNGYDKSNPFTWNYGALTDKDNEAIPGNWRGIYRWYFDCETPHLTPWEMVGFIEKPLWWEDRYGVAPYKRTNTTLWLDMERGIVAEGEREGADQRFVRPGLMDILPIDLSGNLLDPVQARIITNAPTQQFAMESWVFGDYSPIENLWRRSSSFGFSKALAMFLMRPAQFVEDYWDKGNRALVHQTQWIDLSTNDRAASSELMVHGETYDDGTQKVAIGVQTWLVEYMTQHGQAPEILGEVVRGLDVRLAHKMAGFTTRDRLHIDAESFGRIPDENVAIQLYQSPGISADFYSGVIVEHLSESRWRVIGYNSIDPYFDVMPSDSNGRKIAMSGADERVVNPWTPNVYYKVGMFVLYEGYVYEAIKNHTSMNTFEKVFWRQDESGLYADERLYKYTDADGTSGRIPYTTTMDSRQEVLDFLYGYKRSLEARGFGFDDGTWDDAVDKFINWSKVRWAGGSFLTLSPGARSLTYTAPQGYVLNLEGPRGTGTIVNRTGHLIDDRKTTVDRLDDVLTITASGDDIYGVSLRKGEVEHVLVFSNRTIFGDIIYDTTLNVRQDRLRLHARRTEDWNGRYDAPGFMISEGQIVSNFDKSAEDLRYMFDIELADNTVLRDHARHVIGFENRAYLSSLLLNETQQFELYQGMIQQKGARGSLGKIMRSRAVEGNRDLKFMEEWAFRLADFGAFNPRGYLELQLSQNDLRRQQQVLRMGDPVILNQPGVLAIPSTDARWVSDPTDFSELVLPDFSKVHGLPNAGYVRTTEATYMNPTLAGFASDTIDLLKLGGTVSAGESAWLYDGDGNGRWAIKYMFDASNTVAPAFTGTSGADVSDTNWSFVNDAPVIPPAMLASGGIDTGNLGDSGSHFKLGNPAIMPVVMNSATGIYVVGDNSKTMPGTYLYSPRFAVVPGEDFIATMKINVSKGFNGVAYLAVKWFKADGSQSATEHTYTTFRDHRDTAGAPAFQREDIAPQTITVPVDAAFAKLRITVEFSNFTSNTVPAVGQAIISDPIFRRAAGNRVVRVDNHNTNGEVVGARFWMDHNHGISVGESVVVSGPVAINNFDISGVVVVDNVGPDWFEIDSSAEDSSPTYDYTATGEIGPQVFRMIDGRFRIKNEALGFPIEGALLYVDDPTASVWDEDADHSQDRWAVYSYIDPVSLNVNIVREQPDWMDGTKVASSLIYDQNTKISSTELAPEPVTLARITPIDPMIGLIVGNADKEIDFKLEYDPAEYDADGGETLWTDDQVGRLWWDMSTTWFINPYTDVLQDALPVTLDLGNHVDIFAYESDDYMIPEPYSNRYLDEIKYRTLNWTSLAPGASVDIYEWTKSYTAPDPTVLDLHPSLLYVTSVEYSGPLNKDVPVYYFWVKNPTTVPYNTVGRTLDAASCAAMISNPSGAGVPWVAVISTAEMIVSGVGDYLTDDSTVLQLQLQLTDDDKSEPHTQWLLLRPEDEKSQPTFTMWRKLRDSLTGFDDNLAARPNTAIHPASRTGINDKQAMFDAGKKTLARNSFVTMINYQLSRRNIAATQTFAPDALSLETPVQQYLIWTLPDGSRTLANLPPEALYSKDSFGVPLRTSDPAQMDEWLNAGDIGTRVLLDNRFSDAPSWSVWEKVAVSDSGYGETGYGGGFGTSPTNYDYVVNTYADLASITLGGEGGGLGKTALVIHDENNEGLDTGYQYGFTANGLGWNLVYIPPHTITTGGGTGTTYTIQLAKHYDYVVPDLDGLSDLVTSGGVMNGQYVLVQNNSDFDGFWTVIKYTGPNPVVTPPPPPSFPWFPGGVG